MSDATFCFALRSPPQLVSVGANAEALLGYAQEEFLTANVQLRDRIHPEDAGLAETLFSRKSTNTSGSMNLRIRHADGKIRCLKARYAKSHTRGEGFRLELWMEDAGKVSEPGDAILNASFKTLIEHTDDYILLKNCNHVILAASRSLPTFTESASQASELVGKTDYDLHPEAIADIAYRLESRAFAEGRRANVLQQLRTQDGALRWIDNRKYPINGPGGEIIGVLGIAPDITEHVEAEGRLRESEESLREAQRIGGLGSYKLDILSGVWTSSEVMDEIFGIDRTYERTVGGWLELVHPDDRMAMRAHFENEVLGQGKRFDKEYRIVRRSDGAERWVHGMGRLTFDADGRPVTMHGAIQDITESKQVEAALSESKDLLQMFIEHAPAALAMFDREMRYLAASRRWLEMHSLLDAGILGRSHYEVLPEIPAAWREEHRRCLAGERVETDERRLVRADGTVQWVRREVLPWHAGDGSVGGILIFSEDVTERKLAEERLRLAATVFTGAREGITITDPTGTILEVNDAFTRITGYTRDEVLGRNPRVLQSGLQSTDFYRNMWDSLIRDGQWSGEIWNRTKGGDLYPEMLSIHAIRDAVGQVKQYVGLFTDITDVKEHEQKLELAAHYDALTGLPNRALFADRLRQAMAHAHRRNQLLGVAYFDLDGFKAINDRLGQSSGDALLTALAFRMKHALREGDTLARLGGDEFAAVILDLPDTDACLPTLTRMLESAAEEMQIGDVPLRVTASAGVTFYPQTEEVDADVLLRQAGQALYEAKLAGKNRYCVFDSSHDLIARSRHENIEQVRRALAGHEFVLYYQPKVNMRTGQVIGAEALLRWQHPERGLMLPGLFLPVIEDHPLAVEVGDWVIESALAQMEAWQESGFEIPVSVNVSAFELQQPDFVSRLHARLAAHPRVKPSHLELEVLETSALQNVVLSSQVLAACREAGVQISVDDFGTGYSSLVYLKRLPANVLKIDQSFVRDMVDELENLTILKGVLGLAEAFRLEVIAEGVETVDHGLMLLQLGCDCAQGYGIAKPMPAGKLQAWAAGWHTDPRWEEVPAVHANNRAVLFAMVEHRAWYGHFLANLQGTRPTPPPLNAEPCSLSAWLDAQRVSPGGMSPSIQAIETLHQQMHTLAAEIYETQVSGRKQDGLGLLRQLRYLHERCMKRLEPFTRISSRKSAGNTTL
ncbi:MAG: EAL domain-containing protein [Terracidiphilus sp.]|jgi:diguanylate cyclase (GGDEF)-like protein/PAS domain S-box-containing protein